MYQYSQVAVESMGYALPPEVWTSTDLETRLAPVYQRLKLPAGRLELMTGIRERRFWPRDYPPSQASAEAAGVALRRSRFAAGEIELLIHCGVCRDRLEPATAAYVHKLLGLSDSVQLMDISNACLGFLNAMTLAGGMIESGQIQRALLVSGENGRPLIEHTIHRMLHEDCTRKSIKPLFANLTIGAGAVAMVLCHKSLARDGSPRLLGGVAMADSTANELCQGDGQAADSLSMETDSEALLAAGIALAAKTWGRFLQHSHWQAETADRVICHQVGKRHQSALFEALGIPVKLDFPTYPTLGNVGSVSLPISLAMACEQDAVKQGDKVALLGIGSGLCCMMLALEL